MSLYGQNGSMATPGPNFAPARTFGFGAPPTAHPFASPSPYTFENVELGKPPFDVSTAGSSLLDDGGPGPVFIKSQTSHQETAGGAAEHGQQRRHLELPPHVGSSTFGSQLDKGLTAGPPPGIKYTGTFLGLSKGGTANFGFIKPESEGQNVFVHSSNLAENLQSGQMVEYELAPHEQVRHVSMYAYVCSCDCSAQTVEYELVPLKHMSDSNYVCVHVYMHKCYILQSTAR